MNDRSDLTMLETGIYIRVSTEEQVQEGYSIRAQEEKLKDYARIKEWAVYKIYIDDGISGKNITDRPAINEMIADIEKGCVKNVLVFKLDRLTRSVADLINLVDLFNSHNCAFNSLTESIDTHSATGRMFIKILGIFAEFERENISERTRLGMERKVREGYSLCAGNISYGYDRAKGQKLQTVNEQEAIIVREIFNMFKDKQVSYYSIAKNLNSRGIPSKEKNFWHGKAIKAILTNCTYKGYVRYCVNDKERYFEVKGHHEPIISEELYDEVQNLISKMSVKVFKKHPKENSYFAGIVFCGLCGARMTVHGAYMKNAKGEDTSYISYVCPTRRKGDCNATNVRQSRLETAFIEHINNYEDFNTLDEIQKAMKQEIKEQNIAMIKDLKKQLNKLEKREKSLVNAYIQEEIDIENYKVIKATIDTEKNTISGMIENTEAIIDEELTMKREDIIKNLKENWEILSKEEKRQFLINFIEKIEIVNEKEQGKRSGIINRINVEFNKN